jgi:hypothetical protein
MAVSLGVTALHSDTALHTQTNVIFKDAELFEIVAESKALHFDKDENQKFKWYKVKTLKGQIGWLFGDAVAVVCNPNDLDNTTQALHQQKFNFGSNFGEAMLWFAKVRGIDVKGNQQLVNPTFYEQYAIITNDIGKSFSIYLAGRGLEGIQTLKTLTVQDFNANNSDDLIIEKSAYNTGYALDNRSVEIYTFNSSGLSKIFEESLTLKIAEDTPSPALYKVLEIDNQLIRVSFIDFTDCEKNSFCSEYVTTTFGWDANMGQFKPLYQESRIPLIGYAKHNFFLLEKPNSQSNAVVQLVADEDIVIQQLIHTESTTQSKKEPRIWLLVEHKSGIKGYLPAFQVYLGDAEHAVVLQDYFNQQPTQLKEWRSDEPFLFLNANH